MTEIELKYWFFNKLSNCYIIFYDNYPDNILYYYDENFIRKVKMSKLIGIEVEQPKKFSGICLFDQSLYSKKLYCDYDNIWTVFKKEYIEYSYLNIVNLIESWLKDDSILNEYEEKFHNINIKNRKDSFHSLNNYGVDFMFSL